jgi:hypothetical protein
MTLEQLTQLREMLRTAKNNPKVLNGVMGFFSDHLGDELDVLKQAQSTSNPFVYGVLQTFASSLFPQPVFPNLILASLPSYHFYYGPFLVEGLYGLLIYFSEGLGKGLISMPSPDDPTAVQKYKLFTT